MRTHFIENVKRTLLLAMVVLPRKILLLFILHIEISPDT